MASLSRGELLAFLRAHRYAVQTSIGATTGVQAAVVGIAVADNFEILFDTVESSRKAHNLSLDPRIAFVIGGTLEGEERTVQYEGLAERLKSGAKVIEQVYFQVFPDGRHRLSWEGITHFLVRPQWLRYSDFRIDPPHIVELDVADLSRLH